MLTTTVEPPKPGSREAGEMGCTCPVMDNHHGEGFPVFDHGQKMTGFWIEAKCPIHGVKGGTDEE